MDFVNNIVVELKKIVLLCFDVHYIPYGMNDFCNKKYEELSSPWLTFFTPAYNRADTLPRCYESLKNMRRPVDADGNEVQFDWIIVDDGSEDDTRAVVRGMVDENIIPIRYYYQPNQGKHVASNMGVKLTRAQMLAQLDSDDAYFPEAMQVFWDEWHSIPAERRHEFRGVTARCMDPATGRLEGTGCPCQPYYVRTQDMRLRDGVKGDMCGFNRVDVLRKYPYPVLEEKTSFYPESVLWYTIGEKYLESVVDVPLYKYFHDTTNSITGKNVRRSAANYYLWKYEVNHLFLKYVRHSPKEMMKAVVGISMDGFVTGRSISRILADVKPGVCKALVALFMPAGWILSKR